jgi:oligopeptide transport system substrate-binding protein
MNVTTRAAAGRQEPEGKWSEATRVVIFSFFILGSLFLTGCLHHEPPADLTIINKAEPETLDPALITSIAAMRVVQGLFEGLTQLDPKTARPIPGLAKSWDISPDGKIYTFHLRTNLVWSTGGPITATDVVYSWLRALNPKTASEYAGQLYYLKNGEAYNTGKIKDPSLVGVHALDQYTVCVELNHPTPFFLDLCAFCTLYVVPRQTIEKYGDRWIMARPLPSSGPYELVYWRLNDRIRLKKNPRYWDAAHTQSDIIDLLPIGSPDTAFNLYESGAADIVWDSELVPSELLDVLLKRPDFHRYSALGTYFIRFNVTRKPFNNPLVRKALALAVDKERIVTKITRAGEQPASHLVPDATAHYDPVQGLGYDPALAKKLLAEAGYPDGKGFPRFDYIFNVAGGGASQLPENIAVELQQMWQNTLGIHMDLHQMEFKVFLAAQNQMNYEVAFSDWFGDYNDPQTFLGMFTSNDGNNHTGWKNPRYDALIEQANEQTDLKQRARIFQQAETLLVSNAVPIIPLYFYEGVDYFNTNKIKGVYFNLLDDHPLQSIRKIGRGSNVESREPEKIASQPANR